jgi:hypothetical protein
MPPLTHRTKIGALVLATALAFPLASAAGTGAGRPVAGSGLLQQLWLAIAGLVTPDDGCQWDPSGRCGVGAATTGALVTPDDGCQWDPDGRCRVGTPTAASIVTPHSGCQWDPNGRCGVGAATVGPVVTPDSGCQWDPSGGCLPGH